MQAVAAKYQAMNDADRERVKQLRANLETLRHQSTQTTP
jgi:septal ring factor EnvC (AmiA/AmiB activator)